MNSFIIYLNKLSHHCTQDQNFRRKTYPILPKYSRATGPKKAGEIYLHDVEVTKEG